MNYETLVQNNILESLENRTDWVSPEYIYKNMKSMEVAISTAFFMTNLGRLVERGEIESLLIISSDKEEQHICIYAYRNKQ